MSQQQELQLTLEQAEKAVSQADALTRLSENPDFQAIIHEGYFEGEASRLVGLLGDREVRNNPTLYANVQKELEAIGLLREHFRLTYTFGNLAKEQLKEYREAEANGEFDE